MIENERIGRAAKHGSQEFLRSAEHYRDTQRVTELESLPPGSLLSPERIHAVQDVESAIAGFAAEQLSIDITPRLLPVSQGNIRFYDATDYEQTARTLGIPGKQRGFTTVTGFIGVEETGDEGSTLITTQHELVHRLAVRQSAMWSDDERDVVSMGNWRSGVSTPGRFGVVDEAIVIELTRKVKDEQWPHYESLAPFANATEPGISTMANMGEGEFDNGIVYCALFEAMCQRASELTGKDLEKAFYTMHFNGNRTALHDLSQAFDNRAVTAISRLSIHTFKSSDILNLANMMGVKDEFMGRLADYKKVAVGGNDSLSFKKPHH